mgnify:CR=1 FL=1
MGAQSENTVTKTDVMDPDRAAALQIALGQGGTTHTNSPLPPFFHQLYFWTPQPATALGRDGHPKVGGDLIPDLGLPRRMWAGGRLQFAAPLRAGVAAEKRSVLESATKKTGRSGPLGFVTLRHEIWQQGQHSLTEWQDLVYREDPTQSFPSRLPPKPERMRPQHKM